MDESKKDTWAGVILIALFLVMLLGGLAILRLMGH
jgi:hypothetical protein